MFLKKKRKNLKEIRNVFKNLRMFFDTSEKKKKRKKRAVVTSTSPPAEETRNKGAVKYLR